MFILDTGSVHCIYSLALTILPLHQLIPRHPDLLNVARNVKLLSLGGCTQLLGRDLVLWKGKDGEWSVFDDRCPHRAVPLTEGRVEDDGTLM